MNLFWRSAAGQFLHFRWDPNKYILVHILVATWFERLNVIIFFIRLHFKMKWENLFKFKVIIWSQSMHLRKRPACKRFVCSLFYARQLCFWGGLMESNNLILFIQVQNSSNRHDAQIAFAHKILHKFEQKFDGYRPSSEAINSSQSIKTRAIRQTSFESVRPCKIT